MINDGIICLIVEFRLGYIALLLAGQLLVGSAAHLNVSMLSVAALSTSLLPILTDSKAEHLWSCVDSRHL